MSPTRKRRLVQGIVAAGLVAAGAYGVGPMVAPVADRILARVEAPAPSGPDAGVVGELQIRLLAIEETVAKRPQRGDGRTLEARLERERFLPLREYVMALEARLAELEARR